jgi:glyceraldehyde 3-phosphate dehydrogenase
LTQESAQVYLDKGAKKVVMSAPAKDDTPTFVLGVNEDEYKGEAIVSNASCTTNCLGPVAKIIDDAFGIEKGLMTTIHSYTNDQNILDVKHKKDRRRARAGAQNMIPTTTGAAKAMRLVMPQLDGKLHGQSVRVPTPNVSMVDLNVVVKKSTTKEELNALFESKASELNGIVAVDNEMMVSSDLIGNTNSTIIASDLTQVVAGDMIKVMTWYDNEWGYSSRLIDMALFVSK